MKDISMKSFRPEYERCFTLILLLLTFSFLFNVRALAQSNMSVGGACLDLVAWGFGYGTPPGGPCEATESTYPYAYNCYYWNYHCKTGCDGHACGSPISLASGNTYIEQNDLAIPGLGGGLQLIRTWNSVWPKSLASYVRPSFGGNWKSNFEERVFSASSGYMTYARGNGSFWQFTQSGSNWNITSPKNAVVTLASGPSYWTIKFQNGETRQFSNTSGSLAAIVDRNGNTTTLTYDTSNRLVIVTDPASRHLYFTYASSTSSLITSVTSDVGLSLTYTYDSQNRLTLVTKPDGSTLAFEYGASNAFWITAVKDSQGKVLESHTYDGMGRGLSSSRANGVDALSLSF